MKPDDPRQWVHAIDCDCDSCIPYHPAVPPRLTWADYARLGALGMGGGAAAALLLNPFASATALAQLLGLA